jgi:hypothetical protein
LNATTSKDSFDKEANKSPEANLPIDLLPYPAYPQIVIISLSFLPKVLCKITKYLLTKSSTTPFMTKLITGTVIFTMIWNKPSTK